MRQGVYGYLFVPFQPGEAGIMVQRAAQWRTGVSPRPAPETPPVMGTAEAEARLILDALRQCKNNHTRAARLLGIGRNTLWRKLKRIRKDPEKGKVDERLTTHSGRPPERGG
jgi:DNA-binding NtrC family response regulator